MVHHITHPNPLIQKKVNYFADYFTFATKYAGQCSTIELENPLALIDKILYQIDFNPAYASKAIDVYLEHPMLGPENPIFEDEPSLAEQLHATLNLYRSQERNKRNQWLKLHPEVKQKLTACREVLHNKMARSAIDNLISYLLCVHEIDEHKKAMKTQINQVVSEFFFNNRSRKDILRFVNIFSRDIHVFPFPTEVLKADKEAKKSFLTTRTFHQQLSGIFNLLKLPPTQNFYLFKVFGITPPENFEFRYNRVVFYSPKHLKFKNLATRLNQMSFSFLKAFFNGGDFLIACFESEYVSTEVAANEAIYHIESEIKFLNLSLKVSCRLQRFVYLYTGDFDNYGFHRGLEERNYHLTETDIQNIKDNPYHELKDLPASIKEKVLAHENHFLKALSTKSVELYWQYLEAIIPTKENNAKQIVDVVSKILLLDEEKEFKRIRGTHIVNCIINADADTLGIDTGEYQRIVQMVAAGTDDYQYLIEKIKNPFVLELLLEVQNATNLDFYEQSRAYYKRIMWETQFQRNSIVHALHANDKALISLNESLTKIIRRVRVTIFNGIRAKLDTTYAGIIERLQQRANELMNTR